MTTISMMRIPSWLTVIVAVVLAAFGCRAIFGAGQVHSAGAEWARIF
jgi:hypothetical protein